MNLIFWWIGVILYVIGESITEAYTHMSNTKRLKNKYIGNPNIRKNTKKYLLDYHGYRLIENSGFLILIIISFLLNTNIQFKEFLILILSSICIGDFIYEKLYNKVAYGKYFVKKADYIFFKKFKIIRGKYTIIEDIIMLIIGICLLYFYIKF